MNSRLHGEAVTHAARFLRKDSFQASLPEYLPDKGRGSFIQRTILGQHSSSVRFPMNKPK
jgi:hypothetical protein